MRVILIGYFCEHYQHHKGIYMQTPIAVSPGTVLFKTPKGREEISQRARRLSPSQRRVLIVIDGSKNFEEITEMIPAIIPFQELEEIISLLMQQGFIGSPEESARKPKLVPLDKLAAGMPPPAEATVHHVAPVLALTPAKPSTAPMGITLTQDSDTIRQVKDFMATTAHTYLGLLSAEVIQRIERAKDAAQLIAVVGHWHMALRGSKQGTRFAGPYLEQVKQTLAGGETVEQHAYLLAQ
jgi:hypothetical protein